MATADRLATGFTPAWLSRQRWFRAKQRLVTGLTPLDAADLAPHARLMVLGVDYADGGADRYLAAAVEDAGTLREPHDGEGVWAALVRHMATAAELHGARGRFACDATDALHDLLPSARQASAALSERRLAVEQSNTSVVLGERLILKLYRVLEPGVNPDLEVSAFLTDVGFRHTPPLAGSARYLPADGGEPSAAAMLQALVPASGDAWAAFAAWLATDPRSAVDAAARIGAVTAELHAALASRPSVPGFPARPATADELGAWHEAADRQLEGALAVAPERLGSLAQRIRAHLAAIGNASGTPVSRVHGDYHLGQLLTTHDGAFVVIDFEGEPARAIDERRRPASPLRDVAGMLRSFDYAARTAVGNGTAPGLDPDAWLADARSAFLAAYGGIGPTQEALLAAFEIEKACYEVRYEAAMRPDWQWLPVEAIERLLGGGPADG